MADEKKEPWLSVLALTTVVLAVCATLATFKGGGYSTRSVMSQAQAANQWAYYQSKSIKEYLYDLRKRDVELELKHDGPSWTAAKRADYDTLLAEYGRQVIRYAAEKAAIQKDAQALELSRDHAQEHSKRFGMAVIFLQVAIMLSSIAALMKRKPVWVLGLAVGVVGLVYFVSGLLMAGG